MLRLVSVTALILAGACTIARADVFRWIDSDGVVHYSDEWVPGSVLIKTVKPHPEGAASSGTSSGASRLSQPSPDQENSRATQQDVARARDAQCTFAKQRYMKAIESRRVYNEGKDGERNYMSDAEADSYREQARKDVQLACGSVPQWKPDQAIPEPKPIPEPQVKPQEATSPSSEIWPKAPAALSAGQASNGLIPAGKGRGSIGSSLDYLSSRALGSKGWRTGLCPLTSRPVPCVQKIDWLAPAAEARPAIPCARAFAL